MERNVLNRAADYNKKRRKKVRRYKMFTVLAAVVVFCTTYSLIMPAITMETPQCGLEEHTHGSDCYESTLVCTQEESGHTHGDGCYTVTTTRELTCSQEEGGGHTHGSGCYSTETEEVEKTGTRTETVQTGSQTVVDEVDEEGNVVSSHEEPIYEEQEVEYTYTETVEREVLTCTESEGGGHTHDDSCYTETEHRELACTEAETGHTHGEDCYEKTQICELEEHTHDASCYPEDGEGEDVPPIDGGEGEDVPPVDGGEGEDVPPVDGGEGEETPPAETMKPVRVDEEGYILDENGERVLDENGEPIKAEAVAPVEKPEELPEEVTPPENIGAVRVDEEGYLLDENGERVLDENGQPILVEIPDVEVPKTLMMTVLPAGAEVPENYTETYNYVDSEGEYAVTVFAPEGAVPAGAELSATVMWGVRVEAEDGGVVPMDIHFELDGEEIEPVMPVYVVINVENLIPDDADPESVEIQHYKGTDYNAADAVQISALAAGIHLDSGIMALDLDEESAVMDEAPEMELPEDVEVVANSKAGTGDIDVNSDTLKAAFEVGEFSYFTITYKNHSSSVKLNIYLVKNQVGYADINGKNESYNTLLGNYQLNLAGLSTANGVTITEFVEEVNYKTYEPNGMSVTYTFAKAFEERNKADDPITRIRYYRGSLSYQTESSEQWTDIAKGYLHFAYDYKYDEATYEQDAYFYFLIKRQDSFTVGADNHETSNWYGIGKGRINHRSAFNGNNYSSPFDSDKVVKYPSSYPTLKYEGKEYEFSNEAIPGKDTYYIRWVRFVETSNATTGGSSGDPNTEGGFEVLNNQKLETTVENTPTWHIDGYVVFRPDRLVNFYVLDEDGNSIDGIGEQDGFVGFKRVDDGAIVGSYVWDVPKSFHAEYDPQQVVEWYKDKEFTEKADLDTLVINENNDGMNLYGKLTKRTYFNLTLEKVTPAAGVTIEDNKVPMSATPAEGDSTDWAALHGATFKLYDVTNSKEIESLTPGGNGTSAVIEKTGLSYGVLYKLEETLAPNGYNILSRPIYFKADSAEKGIYLCNENGEEMSYGKDANIDQLKLIVANYGGYVLPSTGGEGIFWYTWSGAMLMMAAAYTLMYKKSYRREGLED